MQQKFLDLAVEQGDTVVQSAMDGSPTAAVAGLAAGAQRGLKVFVDTQRRFLDMVAQQVSAPPASKGRKAAKPARRKKLSELAKDGIDAFVAAEKQLLDLASAQIAATVEAARPKPAEASTSLGEIARRGVVNLVTAQKALLDVAAKPFLPPPPAPRPATRRH
jgi:hypothetical protein